MGATSLDEIRALRDSIRADPVRFVERTFGEEVLGKQNEVLRALAESDEVYVRKCHDSGITHILARAVAWFLMAYAPDAVVVTTAPTWNQVEQLLWREIRDGDAKAQRNKVPLGGRMLNTRWDIGPRWFAIGISTDQPVNMQGFHSSNILVVIDEADGVPATIWGAVDGLLTSRNAKLIAAGNPLDPQSEFKRRHDRAMAHPRKRCIRIAATDVLTLSERYPFLLQQKWVDDARENYGEGTPLWLGKVEAEWPDQGEDTIIPMNWLLAAKGRMVPVGQRTLAMDVARYGTDRTGLALLEGGRLALLRAFTHDRKVDLSPTTTDAMHFAQAWKAYAPMNGVIDAVGVGGGVVDQVRGVLGIRVNVQEFNAGARPTVNEEQFSTLGAQAWWNARGGFERREIGFDMSDPEMIEQLINELNQARYFYQGTPPKLHVDKFGLRGRSERSLTPTERSGRSPDLADTFVMGFYANRYALATAVPQPTMTSYFPRRSGAVIA